MSPQDESCDRDPCAVLTAGLATVVADFVASWDRQHPPAATDSLGRPNLGGSSSLRNGGGRFVGRDPDAAPTAVDVLSTRTRELDLAGRGVPPDEIRKVLERKTRLTELRVADAITTAARRPMAFHDGTLRVRPNPYAPASVRGTCCPGPTPASLLGVV